MSTRVELMPNFRTAAATIAGSVEREGSAPPARTVNVTAAAPVSMTTTATVKARLDQLLRRPRRRARAFLPPATSTGSAGVGRRAAAQVQGASQEDCRFR